MQKVQKFLKRNLPTLLYSVAALLVACSLLYGAYGKLVQVRSIQTYQQDIKDQSQSKLINEMTLANLYNKQLMKDQSELNLSGDATHRIKYDDILKFSQNADDPMAVLEIDSINLRLPIYKGTSDKVLDKGVGHFEDTAVPIGTIGSHSVLTGHNGTPGIDTLFTRLDELDYDDTFDISIAGNYYRYKVVAKKVVTPEEADEFAYSYRDPDHASVTLVTCTPYGINSHRLLTTGVLIRQTKEKQPEKNKHWALGKMSIAMISALVVLTGLSIWQYKKSKKE